MKIIPYSPEYSKEIISLILSIQQVEFEILVTSEDQPDLQDIPKFYQHGNGNFWIALAEEKVVGTIGLLDIGNHQAALRKMFVKSAYRGSSHTVAKQLLDELLRWSNIHGIRKIFLGTTAKFLAAHRFYEKNGFQEVERSELPASFPMMDVDTKFYFRDTI